MRPLGQGQVRVTVIVSTDSCIRNVIWLEAEVPSPVKAVDQVHHDHQLQTRNTKKGMLSQHQMEFERSSMESSGGGYARKMGVLKSPRDGVIVLDICHRPAKCRGLEHILRD